MRTRIHLDNDNRDDWSFEMDNSQKSNRRYGLEDMRGFDSLPDKEPKSFEYISNHGSAAEYNFIAVRMRNAILGNDLKSIGLRVQRRRIRERLAKLDPQNTVLGWGG